MVNKKQLVILASGAGTNVRAICEHFKGHRRIEVAAIFSNKENAGALKVAAEYGIYAESFTREYWEKGFIQIAIESFEPELIVLAGFLLKVPKAMVDFYPRSIVNIHPSLLPSFGGKGMYGMHVHKAVYDANEVETGITIHYVNEHYDEGSVIAQHKVAIDGNDGPTDIARKVQDLEHEYFARSLARILN